MIFNWTEVIDSAYVGLIQYCKLYNISNEEELRLSLLHTGSMLYYDLCFGNKYLLNSVLEGGNMVIPIYERETTLYGNDGKYVLIKKEDNLITYKFIPWDESQGSEVMKKKDIKKLGDILNVRILWAVYEDL